MAKPRTRFAFLAASVGVAALLLTSCSSSSAPAAAVPTATPLPAGSWTSLWEADAIWQQIATTATLVNPILRPDYLPPGLTEVRWPDLGERLSFSLVYSDVGRETWLALAAGSACSTPFPDPRSQQQQLVIRHTYATYQLYDRDNPTGDAWLLWQEPGRWGAPDDPALPNLDHVPYCITSRGFSRDDLMKVVDSLRPMEG